MNYLLYISIVFTVTCIFHIYTRFVEVNSYQYEESKQEKEVHLFTESEFRQTVIETVDQYLTELTKKGEENEQSKEKEQQ